MSQEMTATPIHSLSLSLEGRLLAHRRLLVELLRKLPQDQFEHMMDWLDEHALYLDGQEDPGAVPAEGMELELARTDEFQELRRLVQAVG